MSSLLCKTQYCELSYELDEYGQMYLHLNLERFSLSVYKQMKKDFEEVKAHLRNKGYLDVYVVIPENDKFLEKFERAFGFKSVGLYNGHHVLEQEI